MFFFFGLTSLEFLLWIRPDASCLAELVLLAVADLDLVTPEDVEAFLLPVLSPVDLFLVDVEADAAVDFPDRDFSLLLVAAVAPAVDDDPWFVVAAGALVAGC